MWNKPNENMDLLVIKDYVQSGMNISGYVWLFVASSSPLVVLKLVNSSQLQLSHHL